jgi:hypothetical protein
MLRHGAHAWLNWGGEEEMEIPFTLDGPDGPVPVTDAEWQVLACLAASRGQYMPVPQVGHTSADERTACGLLRARGLAAFADGQGRATILGMKAHAWHEAGCPKGRSTSNRALLSALSELAT